MFPTLELLLNKQIERRNYSAVFHSASPAREGAQRCTSNLMERTIGSWETTIACDRTRVVHWKTIKREREQTKISGRPSGATASGFSKSVARKEQPTSGRKHAALSRSSRCWRRDLFPKSIQPFGSSPRVTETSKLFALLWWTNSYMETHFFARAFCPH